MTKKLDFLFHVKSAKKMRKARKILLQRIIVFAIFAKTIAVFA